MRNRMTCAMLVGSLLLLMPLAVLAAGEPPKALPRSDLVQQIDQNLRNLTANLARLDKQFQEAAEHPQPTHPMRRALFEAHRAGWQLHRKQWTAQQKHLQLARDLLQRAKENPEERPQLIEQWRKHCREVESEMAQFRQERERLEQEYLRLEDQLIEQELQ